MRAKLDDVEGALAELGKALVKMAQVTYTEQKTIRLFQPSNEIKETSLNEPVVDEFSGELIGRINDITIGEYDVIVVAGSTLPSNRWAQMEYYLDMYREGLIDQHEVLKKTDVVDAEGVLERSSRMAQMQRMIEDLEQQVKDLQGDLQTAHRASLNDRKRLELEQFKSKLKDHELGVKHAGQLYEERLGDQLQIQRQQLSESEGGGD
jgi:hypothetical protein